MSVESGDALPWWKDPDGPLGSIMERKIFVGKVSIIAAIMLTVNTVAAFIPHMSDELGVFFREKEVALFWLSLVVWIVTGFVIMCNCSKILRKSKAGGIILLIILTLATSLFVATKIHNVTPVALALGLVITVILVIIVAAVAVFAPLDVTGCGLVIFILMLCSILFRIAGFIVNYFLKIMIVQTVALIFVVVSVCLYFWYDLQLIMGGRKVQLDTDEHILAAASLFIDPLTIMYYTMTRAGKVTRNQ